MKRTCCIALTCLFLSFPALGQEPETQTESSGQAGFSELPQFGGPESTTAQLRRGDELRDSLYDWPFFDGYFDWKRQINDDYGVSFGLHFYGLYQKASDSLAGQDDDAFGNIFRFLGNWTQGFANGKAGYAAGRLAFDVYLDAFPFQTFSKGFLNRSFILNPTLPTTGVGALGGVVKGFVTEHLWLGAQIHDANAASGKFDFDTVQEGEWLKAVEIGYTPSLGSARRISSSSPTGIKTSARSRASPTAAAGPSARRGD